MFFDVLYKLARKALPMGLFKRLSGGFLGRGKKYHRPDTYRAIHGYYRGKGLDFKGKTLLEVGPGRQLFTAFLCLADGAEHVLVADPKADAGSARAQFKQFDTLFPGMLREADLSRLAFFEHTGKIPADYEGKVDLIVSHNVLEHISDLAGFFADNVRLLAPGGLSCHRVDVSDHTYHVFAKFPVLRGLGHRRSLYHLRYSDRVYGILGDPKTYMNRRLLPVFRDLLDKAGLKIAALEKTVFPRNPVHPDLLKGLPPAAPDDLNLTDFFIRIQR